MNYFRVGSCDDSDVTFYDFPAQLQISTRKIKSNEQLNTPQDITGIASFQAVYTW